MPRPQLVDGGPVVRVVVHGGVGVDVVQSSVHRREHHDFGVFLTLLLFTSHIFFPGKGIIDGNLRVTELCLQ